jgi:hypothetical protein
MATRAVASTAVARINFLNSACFLSARPRARNAARPMEITRLSSWHQEVWRVVLRGTCVFSDSIFSVLSSLLPVLINNEQMVISASKRQNLKHHVMRLIP